VGWNNKTHGNDQGQAVVSSVTNIPHS